MSILFSLSVTSNYSNFGRGRGRGRQRGFHQAGVPNRPAPSLPNWFQNTTVNPSRSTTTTPQPSLWQNTDHFSNVAQSDAQNANVRSVQPSSQGNTSIHSVFPWM